MTFDAPPEDELVCLCSADGAITGTAPKSRVHTQETPLHRAFSVHLVDGSGRTLLTRRALSKVAWPGVWSNSCCGHPAPGESDEEAVRRRVGQELGATIHDVRVVLPDFRYRAVDAGGIVENEICPVFVATVDPDDVRANPDEVSQTSWVPWESFVAATRATPAAFSPWAVLQTARLGPRIPVGDDASPRRVPTLASTLVAVEALLESTLQKMSAPWEKALPSGLGPILDDRSLVRWAQSFTFGGGKRLRPTMCHWGYVAAGGREGEGHDIACRAGTAIELLHTFALVHDDLMDHSSHRRGMPTAHQRAADLHAAAGGQDDAASFGASIAVLLGDLIHARADSVAAGLPESLRREWDDLCVELIAGQTADLVGASMGWRDLPHARLVADLKSGAYTVARPLRLGALAAGADENLLSVLDAYARHAGRAFALRDDVLGVWGDPVRTGKPAGDDLREGKATVIAAVAAEGLTGSDATLLAQAGRGLPDDDVAQIVAALERAGVRDEIEAQIHDEVRAAREVLHHPLIDPYGRQGLLEATDTLAWRQS